MRRRMAIWSLAPVIWLAALGCCSCPCAKVTTSQPYPPGATALTITHLPTGEIYVDGRAIAIEDLPNLLRERNVGQISFRYIGPEPTQEMRADLLATIVGTGDYGFAPNEFVDPQDRP